MAGRKTLRVELEELRKEVAELRESRVGNSGADSKSASSSDDNKTDEQTPADIADLDINSIETAIKNLTDAGEKEIGKNPLLAVGLAFLLGLLIARASR